MTDFFRKRIFVINAENNGFTCITQKEIGWYYYRLVGVFVMFGCYHLVKRSNSIY